jgi:hypothetical protein
MYDSYLCASGGLKIQWSNGSTDVAGATGRIILTLPLIYVRTTSFVYVSYQFCLFSFNDNIQFCARCTFICFKKLAKHCLIQFCVVSTCLTKRYYGLIIDKEPCLNLRSTIKLRQDVQHCVHSEQKTWEWLILWIRRCFFLITVSTFSFFSVLITIFVWYGTYWSLMVSLFSRLYARLPAIHS